MIIGHVTWIEDGDEGMNVVRDEEEKVGLTDEESSNK